MDIRLLSSSISLLLRDRKRGSRISFGTQDSGHLGVWVYLYGGQGLDDRHIKEVFLIEAPTFAKRRT